MKDERETRALSTLQEAAVRYRVSVRKLQMMIEQDEIPVYRIGPRAVRVDLEQLDRIFQGAKAEG